MLALEQRMSPEAVARMRALFESALLAVAAPCGLLLCHGAPDAQLRSLAQLDAIDPARPDPGQAALLRALLTRYGQPRATIDQLLRQISGPGLDLRVLVHGHDVDPAGWYVEHGNQACPVLFGAAPADRRYLLVDLGARYERAEDLREGVEVLRLY